MRRAARCGALLLALAACALAPAGEPTPPAAARLDGGELASGGTGTLRSEQISVELRADGVAVRVTPLAEAVIRLAAPDAYRRLRELRERYAPAAGDDGGGSVFLVALRSLGAEQALEPHALQLEAGGQRFRPGRILPVTAGWGELRLRPRGSEAAIYVFDARIDPFEPFIVHLGAAATAAWEQRIPALLAERSRLRVTPPAGTP